MPRCRFSKRKVALKTAEADARRIPRRRVSAGLNKGKDRNSTARAVVFNRRDFQPGESEPGRNTVALISDSLWRNYLHASRDVLGETILLDDAPKAVIGVMPPGFLYPEADGAQIWLPDAVTVLGLSRGHEAQRVRHLGVTIPDQAC